MNVLLRCLPIPLLLGHDHAVFLFPSYRTWFCQLCREYRLIAVGSSFCLPIQYTSRTRSWPSREHCIPVEFRQFAIEQSRYSARTNIQGLNEHVDIRVKINYYFSSARFFPFKRTIIIKRGHWPPDVGNWRAFSDTCHGCTTRNYLLLHLSGFRWGTPVMTQSMLPLSLARLALQLYTTRIGQRSLGHYIYIYI